MPPDRDFDRELRNLGPHVDYPPTPDLARSVRGRLEAEDGSPETSTRSGPQLWWIAAAALVLLVALPVFASVANNLGSAFSGGVGGMGGGAAESGGQEARNAGPTHLAEEGGSLAAGGGKKASNGAMQESLEAGGGGAGETGRPNGPVPDVAGLELTAACQKLSSKEYVGYVTRTIEDPSTGPGRVVEQRPRAGYEGYVGGPVDLTVSEPYPEEELRRLSRGRNPTCLDVTQ